nr:uncharacterized protein LOC106688484 isoform X2 [Halyomorpha halys]
MPKELSRTVNMENEVICFVLLAYECREKWRNIRTVLKRKMKSPSTQHGFKKKAYYLEDALQFCRPFIHITNPPVSGNLNNVSTVSLDSFGIDETVENSEEVCTETSTPKDAPQTTPTQPAKASMTAPLKLLLLTRPKGEGPVKFSAPVKKNVVINKNESASNIDHGYFKSKKLATRMDEEECNSQKIDRHLGIKMFLLSLIPELEELNDHQVKLFKRRVFCIIDEISNLEDNQ